MLLSLRKVFAGYGGGDVLRGVDLEIPSRVDHLHRGAERRGKIDRACVGQRALKAPRWDHRLSRDKLWSA